MGKSGAAKSLGAYYTPKGLAQTLCANAIRSANDTVLDPSCGDGAFLSEAVARLLELGVDPHRLPDQVAGVEINPAALAQAQGALLSRHPSLRWGRLACDDFFQFAEENFGSVTFNSVLGNPPYIRYQKFKGRERALALARRAGVRLNGESASWAPFVAVASTFVAPGGRLALVLPRESRFVNYAKPLLAFLRERFGRVIFTEVPGLPFEALQKVSLLFAEDAPAFKAKKAVQSAVDRALERCPTLKDVARVRLGIVTGGKEFFVLKRGTPRPVRRHLVPVVSTPSQLKGLALYKEETDLLLRIRKAPRAATRRYIAEGEKAGIAARFKCRIRDPWYAVPEQETPDAFLTYLVGEIPRIALNRADARATNNLHGVWWNDRPDAWTLAFHNWLTLLSIERIGRVYGGGVLKIEPGDAATIRIPKPPRFRPALFRKADRDLRNGSWERAVDRVSEWLLPPAIHRAARAEWKTRRATR